MGAAMETCCVCGRALPNRYAVAGRCEEPGCGAAFCAMHWNLGGRRCPEHGGPKEYGRRKTAEEDGTRTTEVFAGEVPPAATRPEGDSKMDTAKDIADGASRDASKDGELLQRAAAELTPQARKSILKGVAELAAKIGRGAGALVEKLRGARSPEAAVAAMDAQLAASRERREPLARRHEELYAAIAAKRKVYLAAPAARKKLLELELKGMMAEYKGLEREMAVLLENERVAATVRGRTLELIAMGLRKIREADIDRLTDEIEEAAAGAEDVSGALDDLEKAGARREREGDHDAFEAELAGFAEEPETAATPEAWSGEVAAAQEGGIAADISGKKAEEELP